MTTQQKIKALLESIGLPYREIQCYGNQIVITSTSDSTARKWAMVLAKFAKVRGITKSLDERKVAVEQTHDMTTTDARFVRVFRTFAAVV
jgi:hypothetical protein